MHTIEQRLIPEGMHVLPAMPELVMPTVQVKSPASNACFVATDKETLRISAKALYSLLSEKDREFIGHLLNGCQLKELSALMQVSLTRMKSRLFILCKKLGVVCECSKCQALATIFVDVLELVQQPSQVRFTRRELQIVRLVAQGKSYAAISEQLGIAEGTVKNCIGGRANITGQNIFDKTGCSTRLELMLWYEAHRHALGEPAKQETILTLKLSNLPQEMQISILRYIVQGQV